MVDATLPRLKGLATIIGGPALIGIGLGIPEGSGALLVRAALLPAVVLGVTLLMAPALYIGTAFSGVEKGARAAGAALEQSLAEMGIVLLGLAPALAFLVAASAAPSSLRFLGFGALVLGVAIGLRALYVRLFSGSGTRTVPLFAGWAAVSVGIGARLVSDVMAI